MGTAGTYPKVVARWSKRALQSALGRETLQNRVLRGEDSESEFAAAPLAGEFFAHPKSRAVKLLYKTSSIATQMLMGSAIHELLPKFLCWPGQHQNNDFPPPAGTKLSFFKIICLKMKEIPGAAWTQHGAGTEEVRMTTAMKRQNSLKCLYLRISSLAVCSALKL